MLIAIGFQAKENLFIIASEKEGMPTTLIEMILSNIPVIASDIPGNLSILKDLNEKFIFKLVWVFWS